MNLFKFEQLLNVIKFDLHKLPIKQQFKRVTDLAKTLDLTCTDFKIANDSDCEYLSMDIRDSENNVMECYEGYAGLTWDL